MAEDANADFAEHLKQIKISSEASELYQAVMEDVFKKNQGDKNLKMAQLRKKLEDVNNGFNKADDQFVVQGNIDSHNYNSLVTYLNSQKAEIQYELANVQAGEDNFLTYTRLAIPFLTNLDWYYETSSLHTKRFIAGSIFPGKIVLFGKDLSNRQNE